MSDGELVRPARLPPLVMAAWLGGTFLGTICGIGGGIFAVPLLHYGVKLPIRLAVGTSLVLVLAMTAVATLLEALHGQSSLDWVVVGLLLLGSVPGAQFGYAFGRRADARLLKKLFVALLVIAAIRTSTLSAEAVLQSNRTGGVPLDLAHCAWIVVIGFGGGFLAPLLGVGGGILVIPALFLSLPAMGYLDARACSMAMSVVNAAQSAWLHLRDQSVHKASAIPLSALAVVGAVAGTWAVHLDGWADVARVCMTVLLFVVAARFAWDAWSTRAGRSIVLRDGGAD